MCDLTKPFKVVFAIAAILALPAVSFAQVKVIISGGFSAAYRELLPEFERTSGITVTTTTGGSQGDGPNTIGAQLRRGVPADVVIMNRVGLDDLIAQGRIAGGTDTDVAQTYLGLAVRAGAPRPDISTVDAFRQTLLGAKSVSFDSSTTGIYLTTKLFPRLGIADEMARKSRPTGVTAVASGNAEIVVQPVSEILPVQGVDLVGTIPAEVQFVARYAAAVLAGSKEADASARLIAFLTSEGASAAIKKSGMEPAKRAQRSACEVTTPNDVGILGQTEPGSYGNGRLSVLPWKDGTVVFKPGGSGFVTQDGSLGMKFGWRRGVRGRLTISGRRLDAEVLPLRARIPDGYGEFGFQSTYVIFSTPGCWQVTGRVGDAALTFVTNVVKIGEGPARFDPEGIETRPRQ